ncbi:MAG TPA: hypothetical protein VMG10_24715 [Gemmataceae bacterium]|nr:hypothetical protein [Gemmataceae bacterium]
MSKQVPDTTEQRQCLRRQWLQQAEAAFDLYFADDPAARPADEQPPPYSSAAGPPNDAPPQANLCRGGN